MGNFFVDLPYPYLYLLDNYRQKYFSVFSLQQTLSGFWKILKVTSLFRDFISLQSLFETKLFF